MRRSAPALLVAAWAALLTVPTLTAHAQQNNVVVPNSLANTEGSGNNSYPFNIFPLAVSSLRFQQVFNAGEFGTRRLLITDLEFRPDAAQGIDFLGFINDIQINLSTTSAAADGLSTTFANNVGANNTIVYPRYNLTLSSGFLGPLLGPKNFDVTIRLNTPFVYEPTLGNLLLDVRTYVSLADTVIMDAVRTTGDSVSRVYALDVNAVTGTADSLGLITRFKAIRISSLTGKILLQQASNLGIPLTFEFRLPNGSRFTRTEIPDLSGNFRIDNIPSTAYEVAIKGSKWLQKTVNVDLTSGDVSGFNYTLRGGDANNDNVVDITDLLLLIAHYNQSLPSAGYLDLVDFNNDTVDDISDLLILISNYNQLGDP